VGHQRCAWLGTECCAHPRGRRGRPAARRCRVNALPPANNCLPLPAQFIEEDGVTPLSEEFPVGSERVRPALPDALKFSDWSQVKASAMMMPAARARAAAARGAASERSLASCLRNYPPCSGCRTARAGGARTPRLRGRGVAGHTNRQAPGGLGGRLALSPRAPAPPQVGQAVDSWGQDIWWKGVVVTILPAGAQVYMPGAAPQRAPRRPQLLARRRGAVQPRPCPSSRRPCPRRRTPAGRCALPCPRPAGQAADSPAAGP
jgi:hypothetical protein